MPQHGATPARHRQSSTTRVQNELGQNRAVAGVGGVSAHRSEPKDPYTDAASLWFERDLGNNMGVRVGYTFRTDGNISDDVELARVYSLYTLPRNFVDPGIDGIAGNADDGPTITMFDIPGQAPASVTEERTVESIIATDESIDLTFTKRMSNRFSLVTSYYFNWDRDLEFVQNPNDERFPDNTLTNWNFKVFGTYRAPYEIVATGSLRHQSGTAISRDVALSGQSGQNITGTDEFEAERDGTTGLTTSRWSMPSSSGASASAIALDLGVRRSVQPPQHELGEHRTQTHDRGPSHGDARRRQPRPGAGLPAPDRDRAAADLPHRRALQLLGTKVTKSKPVEARRSTNLTRQNRKRGGTSRPAVSRSRVIPSPLSPKSAANP